MFIHKAILEVIISADTVITEPLECARETITKLDCTDAKTGKTGFQIQFEVCSNLYFGKLCQIIIMF